MAITVFLADDHTVIREGLRLLLEAQGDITVVGEAADGADAVKQVIKSHPDVVVMDIAMPMMNGIEATERICLACPSTRIVILSIHSSNEHIYRALKAGALGYLLKESAGKEVKDAIRAVHSGRRYLSRQITEVIVDDYVLSKDVLKTKSPLDRLSSREREILQLVVEGKTSLEIGKMLFISPKTVETYRSRLMQKLGVKDVPGLVKFALQHGLTPIQ
jgi:DNA-binding NarL/FixJ family response regulator